MSFSVAGSVITQANETGISITAAASITGGVRFTCTQSYAVGNVVKITGTTNYNGNWYVSAVTGTTFDVIQSVTSGSIAYVSSQTGTAERGDSSLSGITGLAGVTTTTVDSSSGFVLYILADNVKLQINGTLCIGGDRATNSLLGEQEMLVLGQNAAGATQPDWRVGSGGVLTIGRKYTNTVNVASSGTAPQWTDGVQAQVLIYQKGQYGRVWTDGQCDSSDSGATINNKAFGAVAQGGTLNWISGTIDCWGGIGCANTSVLNIGFDGIRQKPTIDNRRSGQIMYWYSTSITIYGLVYIGDRGINSGNGQAGFGGNIALLTPSLVFKGYEPRYMYRAIAGSGSMQGSSFTIENYAGSVGSAYDHEKNCAVGQTVNATYKNCAIGTSLLVRDDVDGTSRLYITQKLTVTVKNTSGTAIQFTQVWGISLVPVQSLGTTDASGIAIIDNIETGFAESTTAVITLRWAAGDVATWYAKEYGYLNASFSTTLRGLDGTALSMTLLADAGVTLSRASAAALAAIASLSDLYDAAKYYGVQSANINYPTATTNVIAASGTVADLGAHNILIDATAASAFAVNTGTSTVTIKATDVAVSAKYLTLKTTGTISFANGATSSCTLQGIVVRGTTGVYSPKLNAATVRFTTAGDYDLRGATVSGTLTLTNTSGGNVTVQVPTGLTIVNSGPNITVTTPITVTITVQDAVALTAISGARVLLLAAAGGPANYQESVTITRSGSTATVTHTAHGLLSGAKVVIASANQDEYNGVKTITVTGANTYDYTVSGTPVTPATGTILSTTVVLDGTTDGSGVIQTTTYDYVSSQPVAGKARKGTSTPLYQPALITGTISSSGLSQTIYMIGDE